MTNKSHKVKIFNPFYVIFIKKIISFKIKVEIFIKNFDDNPQFFKNSDCV